MVQHLVHGHSRRWTPFPQLRTPSLQALNQNVQYLDGRLGCKDGVLGAEHNEVPVNSGVQFVANHGLAEPRPWVYRRPPPSKYLLNDLADPVGPRRPELQVIAKSLEDLTVPWGGSSLGQPPLLIRVSACAHLDRRIERIECERCARHGLHPQRQLLMHQHCQRLIVGGPVCGQRFRRQLLSRGSGIDERHGPNGPHVLPEPHRWRAKLGGPIDPDLDREVAQLEVFAAKSLDSAHTFETGTSGRGIERESNLRPSRALELRSQIYQAGPLSDLNLRLLAGDRLRCRYGGEPNGAESSTGFIGDGWGVRQSGTRWRLPSPAQ